MFPNIITYQQSIRGGLDAIKDRIRSLIKHWPTDGTFKEAAIRSVLRRHLPESLLISRGFIVDFNFSSTELDIIIIDKSKPTLFKDGDLAIVTPGSVEAI